MKYFLILVLVLTFFACNASKYTTANMDVNHNNNPYDMRNWYIQTNGVGGYRLHSVWGNSFNTRSYTLAVWLKTHPEFFRELVIDKEVRWYTVPESDSSAVQKSLK